MIDAINYENKKLIIIDQTKLPVDLEQIELKTLEDCYNAIKTLKVRGAPAIGVAAGYSVLVGLREEQVTNRKAFDERFKLVIKRLASSRPTAVNLFWALNRMEAVYNANPDASPESMIELLEAEAILIHKEDSVICRRIGETGAELLEDGMTVLTHCNAGRLATSKYGTALAPIYVAQEEGKKIHVFVDETRPLLQGSRLTAFELMEAGIGITLITDNMAAMVMQQGKIDIIIVGCDRVAANGDTANKIGTYGVATLAKAHNIPFYIAGPISTIDYEIADGNGIPIEERSSEEITKGFGKRTAPENVHVYNPAFDVTPHELITGFITEKGIVRAPFDENLEKVR